MIGNIVALLVVLLVSVLDSADAVSCYQCNYTNSAYLGTSTCTEPFNATIATSKTCSAPLCTWQYTNYMPPQSFNLVYRDCLNDSTIVTTYEYCQQYFAAFNYTVFKYGDGCCYSTGPLTSNGITYSMTNCFCATDNCNGNIPLTAGPSTMGPATTTTSSTNAMPLLLPSLSCKWELIAVNIVWFVAKFISTG